MICQNFETALNELIDAGDSASSERERELEAHAAGCPSCHALSSRYQTLRVALRSLPPLPAPSDGFADRCLAAWEDSVVPSRATVLRFRTTVMPLAAAASLLLATLIGMRSGWFTTAGGDRQVDVTANVAAEPSSPLSASIVSATSATWDLAREASAPAARIGREVIDETVVAEQTALSDTPTEFDGASSAASAVAVIQSVGSRVNEGVRPLSGSARNAFSFLLAPANEAAEPKSTF